MKLKQLLLAFICMLGSALVEAARFDQSMWDALLKKHVSTLNDGRTSQVDYAGFVLDKQMLQDYLNKASAITRIEFDQWNKNEQLAFLINAYNAWTIDLILSSYPNINSIKELGSLLKSPWEKPFIPLLGEMRSLNDIEHKLIRGSGRYNDPRIHFAVNCASVGCPALRSEAFVAIKLDAQLEDATYQFLSDKSRNFMDVSEKTIHVSSIFKWYKEDFESGWRGSNNLSSFLVLYGNALELDSETRAALLNNKVKIKFLDYSWKLNDLESFKL